MNRIGLDMHSASFTMAVVNEAGKVVKCLQRPTSGQALIETVSAVAGVRELVVEESALAQWVKETIEVYVDRFVICDPKHNRWIAKDDFADDRTSAIKLAQLLRTGLLKEVVHPDRDGAQRRRAFYHYASLNDHLVRAKNQLKATYRQAAMDVAGEGIYEGDDHAPWLERLADWPALQGQARHLFVLVDTLEELKSASLKAMVKALRAERGYGELLSLPGAGPVIVCGYLALIGAPERFSKRSKLWRYARLGQRQHTSDAVIYAQGASATGNRLLKWVVGQHFTAAVMRAQRPNAFKAKYEELLASGLSATCARRQTCRKILSVVRAIWRKGERYRDTPVT